MLGVRQLGSGTRRILVLHDWMSDTSSWVPTLPYLDRDNFTWGFVDLRGYGQSRGLPGPFTINQATSDVLALASSLDWPTFTLVGHSMSTLVALHLGQHHPERLERLILLTPPPPTGFGLDETGLAPLFDAALADGPGKRAALEARSNGRLSRGWLDFKAACWLNAGDDQAMADYARMFGQAGLPDPGVKVEMPVLAVTGEADAEAMRATSVEALLAPFCRTLTLAPFVQCGHYPMQEMPPLLVATIEAFVAEQSPLRAPATDNAGRGT